MNAILVMEMPKSCHRCPLFCGHYSDMSCGGNHRTINYPYPDDKVQDWCPLVPVPERKQNACGHGFAVGWNACLDAIEGSGKV